MKRKIVNLGLALVLVFTLAAIVAPVSDTPVAAAGLGDGAYGGYDSYNLGSYDVRYVAMHHDDLLNPLGNPVSNAMGSDSANGCLMEPWRTITHAVDELPFDGNVTRMAWPFGTPEVPDLIVVGRSDQSSPYNEAYGGSVPNDEEIFIDNPVVLVSQYGAVPTIVDVSGQDMMYPAVVIIVSDDVIVDGFTLTSDGEKELPGDPGDGADTGVGVSGCQASPYIDNVQVLNCHIKIDEYTQGTGIDMECVKGPIIDGNDIDVGTEGAEAIILSISEARGIIMEDCQPLQVVPGEPGEWQLPQVTNNELDVKGSNFAVGIFMVNCPKSLVGVLPEDEWTELNNWGEGPNDIMVNAGGDVLAFGIKVCASPLIDIMYNSVAVWAIGDSFALGYGIKVCCSDRSDVIENDVWVLVDMSGGSGGFLMGRGIALKGCVGPNNVADNNVKVEATGVVSVTNGADIDLDDDIGEDLTELEPILLQSLGIDQSMVCGMGSLVGISIKCSMGTAVTGNEVDVDLDEMEIKSEDDIFADACGGGCVIGISGLSSPGISVAGNNVDVYGKVYAEVIARYTRSLQFATGCLKSVALGIILDNSPGGVAGNGVTADADLDALVKAVDVVVGGGAEDSALARFDAEILGAIYLQLYESLEDESIDVALSGDMPGILTSGSGDASAIGIGIMVMNSQDVGVVDNQPASGTGHVELDVVSSEIDEHDALAEGGGMGLGIGIAIIDTRSTTVSGNQAVYGGGTANVTVGATHEEMIELDARASGGGTGIGVGILLCGMPGFPLEAEQLPEDQCWPDRPVVINNGINATGMADPVTVTAKDLNPSHESCAFGSGLAVAMGIAAVWYPGILIEGNTVGSTEVPVVADALVTTDSEAVHPFDPASIGGATAIGIGITTIGCFHAEILNNIAHGDAMAYSDVGATEQVLMLENAYAFGGSFAQGIGILVIGCPRSLVQGNSILDLDCLIEEAVTGRGNAVCNVEATSYIPLNEAYAISLATGIGTGIEVAYSPCTDVLNCNVAAGEGRVQLSATYDADFGWAGACGFSGSYDYLMKLQHCHPKFLEEDVDELDPQMRPRHRFGDVNYNSMIDADTICDLSNDGPVASDNAGLLKMGHPCLDATLNWWNDPTGPSGMGPGIVTEYESGKFAPEPVKWSGHHSCPVKFMPWLYVEHGEVLCEQIGKFGFSFHMCKGLQTFSTPIALEEDVVPSRRWDDIVANSALLGKYLFIKEWTGTEWDTVEDGDFIDPLHAYYIYMLYPCNNIILMANSSDAHPYAMPTRELLAGWSLIGLNPLFTDDRMDVHVALSSIEQTPDGEPGYTQCISPVVQCQDPWIWTPGMHPPGPPMLSGKGYWVWMENPDTLVGFGFSPLPAGP